MKRYTPKEIEPKWQKIWDETGVYTANLESDRPKYIGMSMFNYPSGAGIHIGHALNYTISDVKTRFARQQGFESYHPIGWDAFGLPAENYAIKTGVSPQESMATIIPGYHKQYKAMGWSNDWEKEISTHLPEYYKWSQWIFTEMYRHGLVYQDSRMQWWCPIDNTVLANEQVIDGKCWRHDGPNDPLVEKKEIKQWFFKITDYADELLEATDELDWTESVKLAQKNWIGKSAGAEINFEIDAPDTKANFVILHGYRETAGNHAMPWLKSELEKKGYKVQLPQLPNPDAPVEQEQVDYVLESCKFDENTILVGHSLGGGLAMKVLEKLNHPVKKLVLMAPVIETNFLKKHDPGFEKRFFDDTFDLTYDYDLVKKLAGSVTILSDNKEADKRLSYLKYLADKLAANLYQADANKTHFTDETEPFVLSNLLPTVKVFTTRADTIFGATFLVLAPEHELVQQITTKEQEAEVEKYVKVTLAKSELERQESKEKTGVFTGAYAINPASGEKVPIWIADYVLTGYGTGAIMAVPAHDERDRDFAEKFNLPVLAVVAPSFGDFSPQAIARPVVVAVLHDPKTGKYCVLRWDDTAPSKDPGSEFPGGGIEPGESLEQAVKREVAEETGYDDIELTKLLANKVRVNYTAHDGQKKFALKNIYLAELASDSNVGLDGAEDYEKDHYEVVWLDQAELDRVGLLPNMGQIKDFAFVADVYSNEGIMFNSGKYDQLTSAEARERIVADLAKQGVAEEKINYRMRDWSVSRQRYWGAPIPIIYCEKCGPQIVPDADLPVVLPELTDFTPTGDGRGPLARATDWVSTTCPSCGGPAERETDTLDTYVDSSFYMLRYLDPRNQEQIFDSEIAKKWSPIDFYNGADHATAHMLYARFVTRFFASIGLLDNPEPFKQFVFNGKVTASDGTMFSKSKGNGVDPLEIIEQGYGADALRTYLMFASPVELWTRWDPQGVPGTYRFLNRLWNLVQEYLEDNETESKNNDELLKSTHKTIKKVTEDIEGNRYNTAIAAMMECVNDFYRLKPVARNDTWKFVLESLVACVAPFAPFVADELWQQLGHTSSVHRDTWPQWDEKYLKSDNVKIAVQINGKLRAELELAAGASEDEVVEAVGQNDKAKTYLDGKTLVKTIYIKDKLINLVVK